ncbi:MAG: MbnP family protein [Saprospiraceae bacterium]
MKFLSSILFSLLCFAGFAQTNEVSLQFNHLANGTPMELNETEFTIWNNKVVVIQRAEFYLSEITLNKSDGGTVLLDGTYVLVNANHGSTPYAAGSWDVSEISGVSLGIGVDASVNHDDPATYPASHPLAPQNPSMHWGWAAGYRFMAIEGKVDNNGDGVPETGFEYHNLGDQLYTALTMSGSVNASNGTLEVVVDVDYAKLFENFGMTGNLIHHGSDSQNAGMMQNAGTQDFLVINTSSAAKTALALEGTVSLQPNPASAFCLVALDLETTASLHLDLMNALGQRVFQENNLNAGSTVSVPTAALAEGVYICTVYDDRGAAIQKRLVVSH